MKCKSCESTIPGKAKFCPTCGTKAPRKTREDVADVFRSVLREFGFEESPATEEANVTEEGE